jgi:hypothetical protein
MDLDKILYTILRHKTSINLKFSVYLNRKTSVLHEGLIRFSHFCHPAEILYVACMYMYSIIPQWEQHNLFETIFEVNI